MGVTSSFRMNPAFLSSFNAAAAKALKQTGEALRSDVVKSQVIPFDTGTLQNNSTFVDDSNAEDGHIRLVFQTPYARRLYYHPEYHFQTDDNPNAKGRWMEDWLSGGSKEAFCKEFFAEKLIENGGTHE